METRRSLLIHAAGSLAVGAVPGGLRRPLFAQSRGKSYRHSLLVKGGHVIDPSQGLSSARDIAVDGSRIARVAPSIPEGDALHVIDATGRIVTPGWIDIHVHVYDGVAPLGIPADPNCIAKGVTTAIDAGSAGAHTFPGLRKYVINVSDTRILALLNISVVGQSTLSQDNPWGELLDLRYANAALAAKTIHRHRDVIVGVKVRLTRNIAGEHDLEVLRRAREAADAARLPVMVHIGGSHSALRDILKLVKPGDVITHSFPPGRRRDPRRPGPNTRRGSRERLVRRAPRHRPRCRKLLLRHSGEGNGAGPAPRHDLERRPSVQHPRPVFDLATTVSKFLHLGLTLEDAIRRVTLNPARTFGAIGQLGTLREGAEADIAIFSLRQGEFRLTDAHGQTRTGRRMLRPVATVKSGRLYGAATIPAERL